jgi:glyoxylase I family protein
VIGRGPLRSDVARFRIGSAAAKHVVAAVLREERRGLTITARGMTPLLQVHDMPQSLAFYREVLGFAIIDASAVAEAPEGRFSHWVWLALGSAQLVLNTAYDEGQRPAARGEARQRWHGDTCLIFGVDDRCRP